MTLVDVIVLSAFALVGVIHVVRYVVSEFCDAYDWIKCRIAKSFAKK